MPESNKKYSSGSGNPAPDDWVFEVTASDPAGLRDRLEAIQFRNDVRAVVIDMTHGLDAFPGVAELEDFLEGFPIPLVLAVDGEIKGWAAGVLLASHVCYAGRGTLIAIDKNSDLSKYVGRMKHADFGSKVFSVENAVDLGLVNSLDEDTQPLEAAHTTAREISRMAPLAVRACLKAVKTARLPRCEGFENEVRLFADLFDSKDMRRGTKSFLEKTHPSFEGN